MTFSKVSTTPLSKPRGRDPLPPCLAQDRPPPPSGCTSAPTVSCGATTERPARHQNPEGGWYPVQKKRGGYPPPCQKNEGGYTTPLSKIRGGDPLPPCRTKDRVPPPLLCMDRCGGSRGGSDGRGRFLVAVRKGGTPPLFAKTGYHPLPLSKK
jgi:hypothetical protein